MRATYIQREKNEGKSYLCWKKRYIFGKRYIFRAKVTFFGKKVPFSVNQVVDLYF